MIFLVGLGNPGRTYQDTRHNIGFKALDHIGAYYRFPEFQPYKQGLAAKGNIDGTPTLAFKPMTYMNLSGSAVADALRNTPLKSENVYVIHDDINLKFGQVRVKQGGGAGGHNGLKSLDQHIANAYWRIRIGVDHPGHKDLVTGYVLGSFIPAEQDQLIPLLDSLAHCFPSLLKQGAEAFQQEWNKKQQSKNS